MCSNGMSGSAAPPRCAASQFTVAAFALVLGANIGSAITPVLEGPGGDDPAHRRLSIGNLVTRLIGALAQAHGFNAAFVLLSCVYLAAALNVLFFIKDTKGVTIK